MIRTPVKSSTIVSIGYSEVGKILEVEFKSGTYQYHDVEKEAYDKFIKSESKGKYLFANIRGKYRYERI